MSTIGGMIPSLAITAWILALAEARNATRLARYAEDRIMPSFW